MHLQLPRTFKTVQISFRLCAIIAIALYGLMVSTGTVQAHSLRADNGYTAVLHSEPDGDPLAGENTVLNFFISREGASYNQNDYEISIDISSGGRQLKQLNVEPRVYGNAADGVVNYSFPEPGKYTIDLHGHLKSDESVGFHMSFTTEVTGKGNAVLSTGKGEFASIVGGGAVLALGVGSVSILRRNKPTAPNDSE